ncbi:hypothetical protein IFR05_012858 [Cadophora sp. M221]|nr:hypothetical protein IFR05_012858 [Cadophora sp. M221]
MPPPAVTRIIPPPAWVSQATRARRRRIRRQRLSGPAPPGPVPTFSTRDSPKSQTTSPVTPESAQSQGYNDPPPSTPPRNQPQNPDPPYRTHRWTRMDDIQYPTSFERGDPEYLAECVRRATWGMGEGNSREQSGGQTDV